MKTSEQQQRFNLPDEVRSNGVLPSTISFQNYDVTQLKYTRRMPNVTRPICSSGLSSDLNVRSLTRFGESDPVRRSPRDVAIRRVNGAFLAQIALPLVKVGLKRPRYAHLRETYVAPADKLSNERSLRAVHARLIPTCLCRN